MGLDCSDIEGAQSRTRTQQFRTRPPSSLVSDDIAGCSPKKLFRESIAPGREEAAGRRHHCSNSTEGIEKATPAPQGLNRSKRCTNPMTPDYHWPAAEAQAAPRPETPGGDSHTAGSQSTTGALSYGSSQASCRSLDVSDINMKRLPFHLQFKENSKRSDSYIEYSDIRGNEADHRLKQMRRKRRLPKGDRQGGEPPWGGTPEPNIIQGQTSTSERQRKRIAVSEDQSAKSVEAISRMRYSGDLSLTSHDITDVNRFGVPTFQTQREVDPLSPRYKFDNLDFMTTHTTNVDAVTLDDLPPESMEVSRAKAAGHLVTKDPTGVEVSVYGTVSGNKTKPLPKERRDMNQLSLDTTDIEGSTVPEQGSVPKSFPRRKRRYTQFRISNDVSDIAGARSTGKLSTFYRERRVGRKTDPNNPDYPSAAGAASPDFFSGGGGGDGFLPSAKFLPSEQLPGARDYPEPPLVAKRTAPRNPIPGSGEDGAAAALSPGHIRPQSRTADRPTPARAPTPSSTTSSCPSAAAPLPPPPPTEVERPSSSLTLPSDTPSSVSASKKRLGRRPASTPPRSQTASEKKHMDMVAAKRTQDAKGPIHGSKSNTGHAKAKKEAPTSIYRSRLQEAQKREAIEEVRALNNWERENAF